MDQTSQGRFILPQFLTPAMKKYAWWGFQVWLGGIGYALIEDFWQGHTHISMFLAGGICFWLLIRISKLNLHLSLNVLIGALCITLVELLFGCVLNLWLGMRLWDYSDQQFHFMGQICLRYTLLWLLLCGILMPLARIRIKERN